MSEAFKSSPLTFDPGPTGGAGAGWLSAAPGLPYAAFRAHLPQIPTPSKYEGASERDWGEENVKCL